MEPDMESNVVECELGRDCACRGGPSLSVLKDVQRLYEERMAHIERVGGSKKLQLQVDVLRSWVGDLVGQNTLLASAVEELETETTTRLLLERRRHAELEKKRKIRGNVTELKILTDSLQKENIAKDREIRRLNKDVLQYEQKLINLRQEMSLNKQSSQNVPKKDAEVMAGMCCTGNECGDWEPVRECSLLGLHQESSKHQERIQKMENTLKATGDSVRALRKMNVTLTEELQSTRRVCSMLYEQCRDAAQRARLKDDIIREMRRQLKQAKNKLKGLSETRSNQIEQDKDENVQPSGGSVSAYESVTIACVRRQPRRQGARPLSAGRGPGVDGSGDDGLSVRSD